MVTNVPEFSVTELSLALKRNLEEGFARVRVRGELSKVKIHTSGHLYSDLKDADCLINIVCWRAQVAKLAVRPEEGLEVICTGKITTYPARSNYQMVVETMELAGEGALLKMLEDRRKKLAAEGLFDTARKKPLPFLPKIIGVVTSPTGAVIRDILHRIEDRLPSRVILWPVKVQGDGAAQEIARAIAGFNELPAADKPSVLIVGRGGGSLEDLMAFNEEIVVRAIAQSSIPIVSAVGHETDTSLSDFAADCRAPTPTAAAEFVTPERLVLLATLNNLIERAQNAVQYKLSNGRLVLERAAASLGDPLAFLNQKSQRVDHLSDQLKFAAQKMVDRFRTRIARIQVPSPQFIIDRAKDRMHHINVQLNAMATNMMAARHQNVQGLGRMLDMLSYKSVLERGFALIRNDKGDVISSAASLNIGQKVTITLKDGDKKAAIE